MVVAQRPLLSALLALTAVVDSALASALPDAVADDEAFTPTSAQFFNALNLLNITVGGRLKAAEPFEKACFSTVQGKPVTVDSSACSALQANYTNPSYRVEHFGAYMITQWETCQASPGIEGCLLDSKNPANPLAYTGVNCQLGNIPSHYIEVNSVHDVQAALAFSRFTGVRLSVKNKGHDYKGRSSGKNTLSLWVTGLRSMSHNPKFKPAGCRGDQSYDTITTGAGVFTQDVYEFAESINRTAIGPYHQTVGFSGGYFLGGGHSILSVVYGLGADRVVEVKVVTPDGVYRTANECQNQDLFFALRGGGGSAFGVVIEATHRVEPRVPLQAAILRFTPKASTDLGAWYTLTVDHSLQWANEGWGGHIVGPTLIHVTPLLSTEEAVKSMQPAIDFVNARNGSVVIEELPSWLAFFNKYVPAAQAAVGPLNALGTRLLPSELFSTEEGRAKLGALINETLPFAAPYIVPGTPWLYKPLPGVAGETAVTPAWRDAIWHLSVRWEFMFDDTLEEREHGYKTLMEKVQKFRDLSPGSGAYFNEGDVYEPDHEQSHWGDNYPRLLAIKRKYDPRGLLDCWQCVGYKGPSDPLYQCYVKV
ncbi:FAD-binding domain-containing protein [Earliella scabrosa]|nr:FAD-binding domain-containing protein [Earliella scabrosa]